MVELTLFFLLYLLMPVVVLLLLLLGKDKAASKKQAYYPLVTVMVAARNEEHKILTCLQSLEQLNYPRERLQVLIGNDYSEDNTAGVVADFIKDKPNFHLFHITEVLGRAKAKANVLAQLAHHATGEFFFYTDADIEVPRQWIHCMLAACEEHTGIVTGVTIIRGSKFFHHMQAIDWAYSVQLIKLLEMLNIPVGAMGNNMMIRREAYVATGGFEKLPSTIIEDVAMFRSIISSGWGFKQLFQAEAVALSFPEPGLKEWLHQRKRWMKGAMQLPFLIKLALSLRSLAYPTLLVWMFFYPTSALVIIFSRFALQWLIIIKSLHKIRKMELLKYSLFYEFYSIFLYSALVIFYWLPVATDWKGRKYFRESFN